MKFKVVRHKQTDYATYGTLFDDAQTPVCVTIERPFVDKDNDGKRDANEGRIQHGTYEAVRRLSPKRGIPVWWLCGVPDVTSAHFEDEPTATTCQIHKANFPGDLLGCLGLGTAFGGLADPHMQGKVMPAVTGSTAAFQKFMDLTKDVERITVTIVDNFGAPAGAWA